jgi:hypothetical protein
MLGAVLTAMLTCLTPCLFMRASHAGCHWYGSDTVAHADLVLTSS